MSDVGDMWKEYKQCMKLKKQSNLDYSVSLLDELGIEYTSGNYNIHMIVAHGGKVVNFWPTTGKFIERGSNTSGRGVHNLVNRLTI